MSKPTRISYKDAQKRREYVKQLLLDGKDANEICAKAAATFGRLSKSHFYSMKSQMRLAGELGEVGEAEGPVVAVQPVRQVTAALKRRLQAVVNDMQKGGIERLIVDARGSVQVVYQPAEQIFDLEDSADG